MKDLLIDVLNNENEVLEDLQFESEEIKSGDFVLVKMASEKENRYYVAEIVAKNEVAYEVQYLTIEENNTFIQKNNTIYEVDESDIVTKLPPPTSCGTSEQQMAHLK